MKRKKAVVVNLCSIVFLLLFDAVQESQQTLIFLDWTDRNSRLRGPFDGGELDRLSGDESVKREIMPEIFEKFAGPNELMVFWG